VQSPVSAAVHINSFLLTLWIVRPTPTYVPIRFEKSPDGEYHAVRILDRFQWIRGHVSEDFRNEHLSEARDVFPRLLDAYATTGRLRTALVLAFRGCVSKDWQAGMVCLAASLATLLRDSDAKPAPEELAAGWSRMQALSENARSIDSATIRNLHTIATNILEGRLGHRTAPDENLDNLACLSDILRLALHVALMPQLTTGVVDAR
jgi:hypothetical protein